MISFQCSNCGENVSSKSRPNFCEKCSSWNTYNESSSLPSETGIQFQSEPELLTEIKCIDHERYISGIEPFDFVTGGGLVKGGIYSLAGEPGCGKSTLVRQVCNTFKNKILYVSAEESKEQIKASCNRIRVNNKNVIIWNESSIENVISYVTKNRIKFFVIDSIQVVKTSECPSALGSPNQVRACGDKLVGLAKTKNITIILIVHVTKDGVMAGPKTLEHMIDAPMYLEEDEGNKRVRILRASKNRFGDTSVRGLFEMGPTGLIPYKTIQAGKEIAKVIPLV